MAGVKAKEALEGAPTWGKTPFLFLMEQMLKVNKDVANVKEQLEMFKSEVDGRVTQLEKEVKLTQSRYDATSSEMEGLKKDIQEVSKLRGTVQKQLTKVQTAMDDIEQYSRRNCLIFNGIQYSHFHHTSTLPLRVSVTMLVDYLTRTLKKYKNYSKLPTTVERIWR